MTGDHQLQDRPHRKVVRIGDTVRRPVQPWTPAVHALLRHLETVAFTAAPRVLGFDEEGREVLTYLPGASGPQSWAKVTAEEGLAAFARLLRAYHDAVAGFRPPKQTAWACRTGSPREGELVCHGGFGPWNIVWEATRPTGILDWDYARPAPPDRRHRLEVFADAYGLTSTAGLADAVITVQRDTITQVRRLASQGHEPQRTWVAEGYLGELQRRLAWSQANRQLFAY